MRYRWRPQRNAPWLDSLDDYQVRYWIMDNFDPETAAAILSVRAKYRHLHLGYDCEPRDIVDGLLFDALMCVTDSNWRRIFADA